MVQCETTMNWLLIIMSMLWTWIFKLQFITGLKNQCLSFGTQNLDNWNCIILTKLKWNFILLYRTVHIILIKNKLFQIYFFGIKSCLLEKWLTLQNNRLKNIDNTEYECMNISPPPPPPLIIKLLRICLKECQSPKASYLRPVTLTLWVIWNLTMLNCSLVLNFFAISGRTRVLDDATAMLLCIQYGGLVFCIVLAFYFLNRIANASVAITSPKTSIKFLLCVSKSVILTIAKTLI